MNIENIARIKLANLPTPLIEAQKLTEALEGPKILIKRDDLTGLAMGGNKARKLEFVMADAQEKGADVLITTGASQSNSAMQVAAAGRILGMETVLVLFKGQHSEEQGNMLLNNILDAKVRIMDVTLSEIHKIREAMVKLADDLKNNGRNPYIVPPGVTTPLGNMGYALAVKELIQQTKEIGVVPGYIIVPAGTTGTQSGLLFGTKYYKSSMKVVGISVSNPNSENKKRIAQYCDEAAKLVGKDITVLPDEIIVNDNYVGEGYGIPTKECIEAIKIVSKTEGIFIDPVYTGKAMAALIDMIKTGRYTSQDTIIFMHTGGTPALFAYKDEILSYSKPGYDK